METQSPIISSAVKAVVASVALHEALKRIPDDLRGHSYFSQMDLWQYIAITDNRTCNPCLMLDTQFYMGNELRSKFPDLEIVSTDQILAMVHPNCRCVLQRIMEPTHYIPITEPK